MLIFLQNLLEKYRTDGYEHIYTAVETTEYQSLLEQFNLYRDIYR